MTRENAWGRVANEVIEPIVNVTHGVRDLREPRRARGIAQAQKSLCGAAIAVGAFSSDRTKKCLDRGGRGDARG
jgi:hypothetical protein